MNEECRIIVVTGGDVVLQSELGAFGDENRTILLAFSTDAKLTTIEIDVREIEIDELRYPQATREEEEDDGLIALIGGHLATGTIDEALDFIGFEKSYLWPLGLCELNPIWCERGDVLAREVLQKRSHGYQVIVAGCEANRTAVVGYESIEPFAPIGDRLIGDFRYLYISCKLVKTIQVMAIILDSLEASPSLDFEIVEEVG